MNRLILATLLSAVALSLPGICLAERLPQTLGQDARVRRVSWSASDVIRIDTSLLVNTAIELGPGERINQVLLGDSESFEVEVLSNRNTVSIKPVVGGAATNMTIYTNRRAISFSLTEGRSRTPTFRIVVNMPNDAPAAPQQPGGGRDVGYQFTGDSSLRPLRVWNDGTSTFFEFAADLRPSIFGLNASGYEITQNSQTRGTVVRMNGVRDDYTIRIGDDYVCIRRIEGGVTTVTATVEALQSREF